MRGSIAFAAGLALALAAGWAAFPRVIYKSAAQPVDFSHRVHADKAGVKCDGCHAVRVDGSFAGIPPLEKCSGCHAAAMGTTEAEKRFIDEYVTPQREPAWLSYARQPENVYFSHASHVKRTALKCETCHGNLGSSEKLPPFEQDRIGGYSRDIRGRDGRPGMTMDDCVACHRKQHLELSCMDCHK
jgi:hypothetical protein